MKHFFFNFFGHSNDHNEREKYQRYITAHLFLQIGICFINMHTRLTRSYFRIVYSYEFVYCCMHVFLYCQCGQKYMELFSYNSKDLLHDAGGNATFYCNWILSVSFALSFSFSSFFCPDMFCIVHNSCSWLKAIHVQSNIFYIYN